MNDIWRTPLVLEDDGYSISVAVAEFAKFVLGTTQKNGWQGRLAQRWNREMADLIKHQRAKGHEDDRTALNYVYWFRREAREALEALPTTDDRYDIAEQLESRLPTPQAFQKSKPRMSLKATLDEFSEEVVRIALRGWKNWQSDVEAKWILELGAMSEKTAATQKNYISRFRKAIELELEEQEDVPEDLLEQMLEIVCHPPELVKQVNLEYSTTVRKQVRNLVVIEDWRELVKAFNGFLKEDNPRLKLLGLMAVTGRRFYEICVTGDFSLQILDAPKAAPNVRVMNKWVLRFIGQAKTRGAEGSKDGEVYNIPCLAPAKDVYAAFQWLRNSPEGKMWSQMSSRELNAKINNQINRYLRTNEDIVRHWPKGEKLTMKCLRALYAEIAYRVFAPSTIAKSAYFAQILGHGKDDLETALSYMDYVLESSNEEDARQEMQRLIDALDKQDEEHGQPIPVIDDDEVEGDEAGLSRIIRDDFEVIDDEEST